MFQRNSLEYCEQLNISGSRIVALPYGGRMPIVWPGMLKFARFIAHNPSLLYLFSDQTFVERTKYSTVGTDGQGLYVYSSLGSIDYTIDANANQ